MAKRQFDRPMTADELMEKLRHDPEWVARERERERERRLAEQAFRAEETPICARCAATLNGAPPACLPEGRQSHRISP